MIGVVRGRSGLCQTFILDKEGGGGGGGGNKTAFIDHRL